MKVVHLVGGTLQGGAAKGALAVHKALLDQGVDSKLLFGRGENKRKTQEAYPFLENQFLRAWLGKVFPRIESGMVRLLSGQRGLPFSPGLVGYPRILRPAILRDCDLIHLHWIGGGFLSIRQINKLNKPIVWTLRDEWPYTGGCHYAGGCEKYQSECGACPVLNSRKASDISTAMFTLKRDYPKRIHFVGVSSWIADRASRSSLVGEHERSTILNSIDMRYFQPTKWAPEQIRDRLGLPKNKLLLLAGALELDSPFKGYEVLKLLRAEEKLNWHLVTFGEISERLKASIEIPATHLGPGLDEETIHHLYLASDIFLGPSLQESFGKTLAEASASGLPVVAYDCGGPAEIILHETNGLKVKPNDTEAFLSACKRLASDPDLRARLGRKGIELSKRFHPKEAAREYLKLYESVLENA